eukprot:m.271797 g.271797  ORF g.271797 m.271797 type:complete len:527 (-) comp22839_c1_seq9:85-1665(-)
MDAALEFAKDKPYGLYETLHCGPCPFCENPDANPLLVLKAPQETIVFCNVDDCMGDVMDFTEEQPDPTARFEPGNKVLALKRTPGGATVWATATVATEDSPGTYQVKWLSGSLLDCTKTAAELRAMYTFLPNREYRPRRFRRTEGYLSDTADVTDNEDSIHDTLAHSDALLSPDEQSGLVTVLDQLAAREPRDFHPGSNDMVLNLFHPASYPYVKGISRLKNFQVEEWKKPAFYGHKSRYQWLPCEIQVQADGSAEIQSYISGLGQRNEYPEVYKEMEMLFSKAVPLLNTVLAKFLEIPDFDMRGKKVQVVCKSVYYMIPPHEFYEGVWHVEGSENESIAASAIYYVDSTPNLKDLGLGFRRSSTEEERNRYVYDYRIGENEPDFNWENGAVSLGTVETLPRRMICFPNNHQHRVLGLINESDAPAVRKIVCFFVVTPGTRVMSTEDVPDQRFCQYAVADVLQQWSLRRSGMFLPMQLVKQIVDMAKVGFTPKEARHHREKLMMDRKYDKDRLNRLVEKEINLCEH